MMTLICRVIFSVTFIFSGFVKAIDPWGTSLNVNNYLASYSLEALLPFSMPFSIWLCGAELMMGCMLLFRVRIRLISVFAVISMTFFTILTFLSATLIPVEDCGCFGEAIHLTPWGTFFKNLALLPMALIIWYRYRPDRIFYFSRAELLLTALFGAFSMGLGVYSYYHLPLLDFLPYREGVNIQAAMDAARAKQDADDVVLVYRNRRTGKIREFSIRDHAWRNEKNWEWVETRIDQDAHRSVEPMILEFFLSDKDHNDVTDQILSEPGRVYFICTTKLTGLDDKLLGKLQLAMLRAHSENAKVVVLTPDELSGGNIEGLEDVTYCNIDSKTMKTMLRAEAGVIILENGTIIRKLNYRDIR